MPSGATSDRLPARCRRGNAAYSGGDCNGTPCLPWHRCPAHRRPGSKYTPLCPALPGTSWQPEKMDPWLRRTAIIRHAEGMAQQSAALTAGRLVCILTRRIRGFSQGVGKGVGPGAQVSLSAGLRRSFGRFRKPACPLWVPGVRIPPSPPVFAANRRSRPSQPRFRATDFPPLRSAEVRRSSSDSALFGKGGARDTSPSSDVPAHPEKPCVSQLRVDRWVFVSCEATVGYSLQILDRWKSSQRSGGRDLLSCTPAGLLPGISPPRRVRDQVRDPDADPRPRP